MNILTRFKNMKLKRQLFMLISISIVMLMLTQLFYFLQFYKLTQSRSMVSTSNVLNQMEENMSNLANDVRQSAETVAFDSYTQKYVLSNDPVERFEDNKVVANMIKYVGSSNKSILDIIVLDTKGREVGGDYPDKVRTLEIIDHKYSFTDKNTKLSGFYSVFDKELYGSYYAYVNSFPNLRGSPDEKIGTCIVIFKTDSMQNIIEKVKLTNHSMLFVLDPERKIIAANNKSTIGSVIDGELQEIITAENQKQVKKYKGEESVIQIKYIESMDWTVVSLIPMNEMTGDMGRLQKYGVISALVMTAILVIIGIIINWNITRPITRLINFMRQIGQKNIRPRIEITESNEVGQLAVDINKMLEQIENMNTEILFTQKSLYQMRLVKKQAELSALQSQVNPHFLYNTLDCVRSIAISYHVPEIECIATSMAKMFRYSIKEGNIVKILDEINSIRDFLEIMKIRYEGKFVIQYDIDERILEMSIIKFILQPIVENSIYHGLERKNGPGLLKIKGELNANGDICFEINDNGKGISSTILNQLESSLNSTEPMEYFNFEKKGSIGLVNINHRMKNVYGPQYGIHISSIENEGTVVQLCFPASV